MTTVIMAAGSAERWGNHLGVPKQLVEIDGEPILRRTISLASRYCSEVVLTVPQIGFFGAVPCEQVVGSGANELDKFLNARHLFDHAEQVVFLWGDCYFTEAAMQTIYGDANGRRFFGRAQGNAVKEWGELFALKADRFVLDMAEKLLDIQCVMQDGERYASWELYRICHGYPLREHFVGDGFTEIADETDDFDYPDDYDRWMQVHRNPGITE
jgi:hypothetical protein